MRSYFLKVLGLLLKTKRLAGTNCCNDIFKRQSIEPIGERLTNTRYLITPGSVYGYRTMDEDLQRIKSLKFARSYKEAHGYYLDFAEKSNKVPWIVFAVCTLMLLVL
jgi:hypothetical protein